MFKALNIHLTPNTATTISSSTPKQIQDINHTPHRSSRSNRPNLERVPLRCGKRTKGGMYRRRGRFERESDDRETTKRRTKTEALNERELGERSLKLREILEEERWVEEERWS